MVPRLGVGEGNAVNHHMHLVKGGTAHRQVGLKVVEAAASQVKACEVGFHDLWGMLSGHERLEHKGLRSMADVYLFYLYRGELLRDFKSIICSSLGRDGGSAQD